MPRVGVQKGTGRASASTSVSVRKGVERGNATGRKRLSKCTEKGTVRPRVEYLSKWSCGRLAKGGGVRRLKKGHVSSWLVQ